jgi:tRNA(Ile)-lysidine synthase
MAARGSRRELSARHVEQVLRLASESTSGRRLELPGGIAVERVFNDMVFRTGRGAHPDIGEQETSVSSGAYQYQVELPEHGDATVSVPELGKRFHLKVVDWPLTERDTKTEGDALDAHLLRAPLILRNWKPGDAYRPRGHEHARKLKEMFAAERIPARCRSGWPVLESAGQIVWSRGMPPADGACARKGTRVEVLIEEDSL